MMSAEIKQYQATDHILRIKRELQMKSNSLAPQPFVLPGKLTAYNTKSTRRNGVIKLMPPPSPPDDKTIRELNALAAKHPFCSLHKVKKHDPL